MVTASAVALLALSASPRAGAASVQTVFSDSALNGTGGQDFVVPAAVCSVNIVALGAAGGAGLGDPSDGRAGGTADATISVTPGETLHVFVGGKGGDFVPAGLGHGPFGGLGGLNGGGDAGDQSSGSPANPGGGGGGASDVRQGGTALGNRIVVAGGGGGGGGTGRSLDARGGTGGGTTGDAGLGVEGGGGGTQSTPGGGAGGGATGGVGVGGAGASGAQSSGGGGGGGFFGGGGGGTALILNPTPGQVGSGGGGGSGFTPDGTGLTLGGGNPGSDGQVTISYDPAANACPPVAAPVTAAAPRFTG